MNHPYIDKGGSAFPVPSDGVYAAHDGMSLRDFFAAHALTGLLSNEMQGKGVSRLAYTYADDMIRERQK
jgi:hypothetical protein